MSEHLRLDLAGPVATLTIDRPAKRNAISFEMWSALPGLLGKVEAPPCTPGSAPSPR